MGDIHSFIPSFPTTSQSGKHSFQEKRVTLSPVFVASELHVNDALPASKTLQTAELHMHLPPQTTRFDWLTATLRPDSHRLTGRAPDQLHEGREVVLRLLVEKAQRLAVATGETLRGALS